MGSADIARRYIEAVSVRDFDTIDRLFGDGLIAASGGREFDKAEWTAALRRLVLALEHNEIRHVFADGGDACVVYDFVTDTETGAVPCVEVVHTSGESIDRIELIFERAGWDVVLAAIAERAAA
jgi:hypothetical protein